MLADADRLLCNAKYPAFRRFVFRVAARAVVVVFSAPVGEVVNGDEREGPNKAPPPLSLTTTLSESETSDICLQWPGLSFYSLSAALT